MAPVPPSPPQHSSPLQQGPAHSPRSTAKPILQSMAGKSIQAVTKDEWGPPADMEQRVRAS